MRVLRWDHCQDYEYQIRKETAQTRTEQALWTAYHDQAHRMEHWITFLTIPKSQVQLHRFGGQSQDGTAQARDGRDEEADRPTRSCPPTWQYSSVQAPHQENVQSRPCEPLALAEDKGKGKKGQKSKGKGPNPAGSDDAIKTFAQVIKKERRSQKNCLLLEPIPRVDAQGFAGTSSENGASHPHDRVNTPASAAVSLPRRTTMADVSNTRRQFARFGDEGVSKQYYSVEKPIRTISGFFGIN